MGISVKDLKRELGQRGLADNNLVAFGQNVSNVGYLFGAVGSAIAHASAKMHAISISGNRIIVMPFTNKEILFDQGVAYSRQNIASAKVSGLLSKTLKLNFVNGQSVKLNITAGAGEVKKMLNMIGL